MTRAANLSISPRESPSAWSWLASPVCQAALLAATTVLVLFLRRPDQFLHPYIWVEEGQYVLRQYISDDIWILINPLAGYSQLASKIIAYLSFKLSILWAPEIALILSVLFTAGVVVAVALSPTHLRWHFLCAIAVLLVPTDAEVFAVSAYAFWWAGVLLFLAVLWNPDRGKEWIRWLFIVLGGLSSPILGAATMLIALRAAVERRSSEYLALGVAILVTIAQVLAIRAQGARFSANFGIETIQLILGKYIGGFLYNQSGIFLGLLVLALVLAATWSARERLDRYFYLLVLMFFVVAVVISLRLRTFGIDKFDTAPRYFFYPFILLSWILIWIAAVSMRAVRIGVAGAFAIALLVAGSGLSRRHDAVDWRAHLLACAKSDEYEMPFHYIGKANDMWEVPFTGEECRQLLAKSLY